MRPRLLDLFCGAGGCSVGYDRAGFDVTGVDIDPHPDYPYPFEQADAMAVLADRAYLDRFDVVHASPPCQGYSTLNALTPEMARDRLIEDVRGALRGWGGTGVMENVESAPMPDSVVLCGSEFGLGATCRDGSWHQLRRHRRFESNRLLMGAGGCHHVGQPLGVYGHGGGGQVTHGYKAWRSEAREAMGIDWMRHEDVVQAIPPAYTEHIGAQLLQQLAVAA